MDQKYHLLSNATEPILDELKISLRDICKGIDRVEDAILESCFGVGVINTDAEMLLARRYLYYYTLPLIDSAGLLQNISEDTVFWATVQLFLGLHLRYIDYIIDREQQDHLHISIMQRSHTYLLHAQQMLAKRNIDWLPELDAVYIQFFDYESKTEHKLEHDLGTIWRRVSPLCVIGEHFLHNNMIKPDAFWWYKSFLGWSLVQADCDDFLKDIVAGATTPVTQMILQNQRSKSNYSFEIPATIQRIKTQLDIQTNLLRQGVDKNFKVWHIILELLNLLYSCNIQR